LAVFCPVLWQSLKSTPKKQKNPPHHYPSSLSIDEQITEESIPAKNKGTQREEEAVYRPHMCVCANRTRKGEERRARYQNNLPVIYPNRKKQTRQTRQTRRKKSA
jgi:hypothetical protein